MHLARRGVIAGDRFTVADISVACDVQRWRRLALERKTRADLGRRRQGILPQAASRGVLDIPLS